MNMYWLCAEQKVGKIYWLPMVGMLSMTVWHITKLWICTIFGSKSRLKKENPMM